MPILVKDIWPIESLADYKIHFARHNQHSQPLEVWVRSKEEWQGWQEYWPGRNDFNRPLIFSLMQFHYETDIWLLGGVFRVLDRHADRYEVELTDLGKEFIGRLKIRSSYRNRTTRTNMEPHYPEFEVQEILREPYSGRAFCGYDEIDLSFEELEALIKNDRPDWKTALESVKGIYLITDTHTGKRYIGSAYGDQGIWSRWKCYIETGHGGNKRIHDLIKNAGLDYCRSHFRFALLEQRLSKTPDEKILEREIFWKRILLTRGEQGLNCN
jgi:hypothetical protein